MSILSVDQYLKSFFEIEKKRLLNNYPGLNLHRLRADLELYASLNGLDINEFFDSPYLPSLTNPITIFFDKLQNGIPLEHITGLSYFYRSSFKVSKDVLIPRSETEILVELAEEEINKNFKKKKCRIADVGTGSGVIALCLMMDSQAVLDVVATDISEKALLIAKENYFNHRFAISEVHHINFLQTDRLYNVEGSFDIILSNPPYIKRDEDFATVHTQVKSYEPHLALFLDDEKYDKWFLDFFKDILAKLNPAGIALIEGHENHLEELAKLALSLGFTKALVIKDYTNRNRFLKLYK